MVKKLNQQLVRHILIEKGFSTFSPLEFKKIFQVSDQAAQLFIHRQSKKNFFIKLRNGLYTLSEHLPSELEVANRLYQPSYISFEYALSFYHLIPESVYTITSATNKASRSFITLNKTFLYHRLKRDLFTGYLAQKIDDKTILIARPEKALLDYFYFVFLDRKKLFDRFAFKTISPSMMKRYLKLYNKDFQKFALGIYDRYKNY